MIDIMSCCSTFESQAPATGAKVDVRQSEKMIRKTYENVTTCASRKTLSVGQLSN